MEKITKLINEPIFKKPIGESQVHWSNTHSGTISAVTCELCGTNHEELSESWNEGDYTVDRFLGMQLIEECCGKAIDILYTEFAEEFTIQFLKEFGGDPLNIRFSGFISYLEDALKKAKAQSEEMLSKTRVLLGDLEEIKEDKRSKVQVSFD